ncbi:hypothetical protein MTO96_006116 [Rhipicephalus appendiculatus]
MSDVAARRWYRASGSILGEVLLLPRLSVGGRLSAGIAVIAVPGASQPEHSTGAQECPLYTEPEITDPVVQAAISAQRRAPGVHIYLDAAYQDTTKNWVYSNVIYDVEKITSGTMTYTFLVQIHKDNPEYAIGFIVPDDNTVGAKTGYEKATKLIYGSVITGVPNTWWTPCAQVASNATLKAGEFYVHTMKFTYPSASIWESEMTPRICIYDKNYPRLSDISAGGSAVIIGSYIAADPKTKGIMIGYYQSKKNVHVFNQYTTPGVEIVFQITVTNFAVSIATKDERVILKSDLINDGWYTLLVQNIDITNMEIAVEADLAGRREDEADWLGRALEEELAKQR